MLWGTFYLQATAKIMPDDILDLASITLLNDDSSTGPPTYLIPLAEDFPPPPSIPPIAVEIVAEYVQAFLYHVKGGDVTEIVRFLLTDDSAWDDSGIAQRNSYFVHIYPPGLVSHFSAG